ncbi:MAG: c(7)-type cytochrome triheme domain-containing protein [Dehalococcoidia bacterium]
MATRWSWALRSSTIGLAIALATAGVAQVLPRLPQDIVFPQGEESLGTVTFSHLTHVDEEKPDCTGCHPALFRILKPESPADRVAIEHSAMEDGAQCGACHDGETGFAQDDCLACHVPP